MLKRILILATAVLSVTSASAQFNYTFKDTTTAYAPLVGATSMNGAVVWDEEIFSAPMPFTWTIDGNKPVNDFFLSTGLSSVIVDTNSFSSVDGFLLSDIDIADRGTLTGAASLSPLRYLTTGTAPNRIFKFEMANAGFYTEFDSHGSMDDSISMQVWVYEGSNIVEFHYGPSKITYPSDYYGFGGSGPATGYSKGLDFVTGQSGSLYFLSGNPASPSVDSLTLPTTTAIVKLSDWPANGKVYRFTPKSHGVGVAATSLNKLAIRVYPTAASSTINIQYLPEANEIAEYQISSVTGALMSNGQLHSGAQRIDVSAFATGTYYLRVKTKNASGNYYFIKQ